MPVDNPQPRNTLYFILSVGLALGVIAAASYYGRELIAALRTVDRFWLIAGLVSYALNYMFRAVRLFLMSKKQIRVWPEGLHAACLHGFATYMMPFRSGELTLPLTLQATTHLTLAESSRLLIRARFLDLHVLGLLTIFAALTADVDLTRGMRMLWFGMGGLLTFAPHLLRIAAKVGNESPFGWLPGMSRFAIMDTFNPGEFVTSLAIWTTIACCFFFAARAIGLPLSPTQVWLLVTLQLPLQIIPIQGFANAGNHEGGWVAGLVLLGVPASTAFEIALTTHAILLTYVLVLGPTALLTGRFVSETPVK